MPCLRELPVIDKLASSYTADQLAAITITADPPKSVNRVSAKVKLSLPVLRDEQSQAFKDYRVFAIPALYLIDQQGNIYSNWVGGAKDLEKQLKENIEFLLSSKDENGAVAAAGQSAED